MKTLLHLILVCIMLKGASVNAQSTVSTGNTRNVVLETTVSVQVGFSPHAYCIEDSLRPNSNLTFLNYHSNFGSQLDTLHNSSVSDWMSNYQIASIPTAMINREPYAGSQQINRDKWPQAYTAQANTSPVYKLTMSASRKGNQLRIFLEGTSLASQSGEYRFNAIISEDSLVYNQTNFNGLGYCSYMNGGSLLTNFIHRDVVRNSLASTFGIVAATNPAINQVDTMSLYFNIPAHYNINRLKITGLVLKYGNTRNDRKILNAISMKAADACQLQVTAQPANQQLVEGNTAQFSVTANQSASFQWQIKNGSTFQNLTNNGQYSGTTTSTLKVDSVSMANQGSLFRCLITSGQCADTSLAAQLNVLCATQISTQPVNQQILTGNNATFSLATISPLSQKQWQINLGAGFVSLINIGQYSGVFTDQLLVSNVNMSNNNELFRCLLVKGGCYDTSASVKLTVLCAPQISSQPANTTVQSGSAAQFSVNAINSGSSFQWQTDVGFGFQSISNAGQFNGVNTSVLTVNNTTPSNNSQLFRCIVSSGNCLDTSKTATLTVNTTSSAITPTHSENGIVLFPNPASEELQIKITSTQLLGNRFFIFDLMGREIFSGQLEQGLQIIPLTKWENGLYFFKAVNTVVRFQVLHH